MPSPPQSTQLYVFDASSLINLEMKKSLSILSKLGKRVAIPHRVKREVYKPGTDLQRWVEQNGTCVAHLMPREHAVYYALIKQDRPKIHDGEAAAIAIALHRGGVLVIDETAARREAESRGVSCLSADQLLDVPLL